MFCISTPHADPRGAARSITRTDGFPMPDYVTPHWRNAALVVIDLQADFLDDGVAPIPGTLAIVPKAARLASAFRAAGRPIAHVVRLYEPGGSDVDLPRRSAVESGAQIAAPDSPGSQIAPAV